jgi:hypothetical protein
MSERTDHDILTALGVEPIRKVKTANTPREARIIAGFEDIQKFFEEHGRPPQHGEHRDIFERLYAVRLDRIRAQGECRNLLKELDHQELLSAAPDTAAGEPDARDDDAILAALGVSPDEAKGLTDLRHVRSHAERQAAEEIGDRKKREDFGQFEPLFEQIRQDVRDGRRKTRRYARMAGIKRGEFFIVNGQIVYVAEVGKEFETDYDRRDSRLRVIYDNGTESDILLRPLQRALHRDETGRRVTEPDAGPLFDNEASVDGSETGTIYVLRSLSDHPEIASKRDVVHKIGVTGGDVDKRIAIADRDPTFLMAPAKIVATYKLVDINRTALENLLHRFFGDARLDITISDRFGRPIRPREWFLVPLSVVDDVVRHLQEGRLHEFAYDPSTASLRPIRK